MNCFKARSKAISCPLSGWSLSFITVNPFYTEVSRGCDIAAMKRMDDEEDCSQSLTYRAVERHSIFIPSRAQMQWLMRVLLWSALCGVLGFIAGVHRSNQAETVGELGTVRSFQDHVLMQPTLASVQLRTFELNSTFIEAPSPESDAAWASLIPCQHPWLTVKVISADHWQLAEALSSLILPVTLFGIVALRRSYQRSGRLPCSTRYTVW